MRQRKPIPNDDEPLIAGEIDPLGKAFASRAGVRVRELRKVQALTLPEIDERDGPIFNQSLAPHRILAASRPMAKHPSDRNRVIFIAPPKTLEMYDRAAELLGVRRETWIRSTLYTEAYLVLEEHGVDTTGLPPPHIPRPARLQPRMTIDDEPT